MRMAYCRKVLSAFQNGMRRLRGRARTSANVPRLDWTRKEVDRQI